MKTHALVGENGAGKSTLVKLLAGVHQPDEGEIWLDGRPIVIYGPAHSRSLGIAVVHQEPSLFPGFSLLSPRTCSWARLPGVASGLIHWAAMRRQARELFEELGVTFDVSASVRGLSMADQQLMRCRALSIDAGLLILDEPTASLSLHEVERLFTIVRHTRDRGVAVLFVSHRLEEVFALCERATVLRDGRHVITARTSELTTGDRFGTWWDARSPCPECGDAARRRLARGRRPDQDGPLPGHSFSLRAGEIVGLAGLVGAGRTEVARVLFGIDHADSGRIAIAGETVAFERPDDALRAGIAYLPEDRHQQGLVVDFSITQNISLPISPRLFPRFLVHAGVERRLAEGYAERLRVRMTDVDQLANALSGGNQQKVVFAKWLASEPRVLILDEPTPGDRYRCQGRGAPDHQRAGSIGAGDPPYLSDLPEVLAMSDRIIVLHEGAITAELSRDEASEERVMFAATGQQEGARSEGQDQDPPTPVGGRSLD